AKVTKGDFAGKSVTCKVDIPDDPNEFVKKYSLPVVVSGSRQSIIVNLQDLERTGIKAGLSPAEIQKTITAYKPELKKRGKTKAEKLADKFAGLSADEKRSLLARLT
ncbi:MAG: hypothetical protein QQN63_12990, partial [Nitrosopumilus sp.]